MKQFIILVVSFLFSSVFFAQNNPLDSIPKKCFQPLQGVVSDFKTGEIIPNALLQIYNANKLIDTVQADKDAHFSFNVACNKRFNVIGYAENFANNSTIVFSTQSHKDRVWDIKLFPIREFIFKAPNKFIDVDNITYVEDHIAFAETDYKILDKVIGIMLKYPSIKVSINVHTDSNGIEEYNLKMTKDRADLILSYLIDNGIDPARLGSLGLGSSQLLNHCTPEVKCYESEHRINRRTEFAVL